MALSINIQKFAATIAAGASLSGEVDLGACTLCGIVLPAALNTGNLSFQVSVDGGLTWNELAMAIGGYISYPMGNSLYLAVDPTLWRGINAVKVRTGAAASPVVQAAQVIITLIARPNI